MAHKIADDVVQVLRDSTVIGNTLTLPNQLERTLYQRVNKVLEIAGFKWNRKEACHNAVNGNAGLTLAMALDDGSIVDPKKEFDFFETPLDLAQEMAKRLNIQPCDFVLEPSAGHGRLALAAAQYCGKDSIVCYEVQASSCEVLRNLDFGVVHCVDFLAVKETELIRRPAVITMNPPFSNSQDISHCRHAYNLLKPGGHMACITSVSWEWRTGKKLEEFRAWYDSLGANAVKIRLPAGTFKDSGTNVPALLLVIEKA